MKFFIVHPQTGSKKPTQTQVSGSSLADAKAEYLRLQKRYPSREMALYGENEYGDRMRIHAGHWD